jgi:hypothetical protein
MLMALSAASVLVFARAALADDWLPHPANAQWQYQWTDTSYDQSGTTENVVVQNQAGSSFTLAWADSADQPPPAGNTGIQCPLNADIGEMTFQDSSSGMINTDWNSCPPPSGMPVLCASAGNCTKSLSSTLYDVIWGNRVPVLSEPLLAGTAWNATGGVQNEVSSTSQYLGLRPVKVPAFPTGVIAAEVQTTVALGGTLGDDYGSGVRTTWWVRAAGPVRVAFDHVDGSVSTASLRSTNLRPSPILPDADYFPLASGPHGALPDVQQQAPAPARDRAAVGRCSGESNGADFDEERVRTDEGRRGISVLHAPRRRPQPVGIDLGGDAPEVPAARPRPSLLHAD